MSGFVRDHISLYADVDVEFNSLSEDHQDLAPEDETHNVSEIHSIVSSGHDVSESYRGSSQRKQMRFLGGNRLRSSIVMEC